MDFESRDFEPRIERADEDKPAAGTKPASALPCPEDTESLIPWLRESFPEISPRTSDPRVVDACIARAAICDLIGHIEASLEAARDEQKESRNESAS